MAYVQADRVQETTTTTSTGTVTLAGAVTGYRTFASQMATSDTCYYVIVDPATGAWESGIGTLATSTTLARTTVVESSNSNAAVSFAAGSKYVFMTQIAKGAMILPAATSTQASLVMTPGSAPAAPANGWMWLTSAGMFMYFGGALYGPMLGPSSGVAQIEYNSGSPALVLQNLSAAGYMPALIRLGRRGAGDTATPNGSAVGEFRFEIKDSANAYKLAATIGCSIGTNAVGGAPTDLTFATSQGAAGLANALTLGSDQRAVFFGVIMPMTGTTGKPPIDFTAGTDTSSPQGGAMEYGGKVLTFVPDASAVGGRGVVLTPLVYSLTADRALSNVNTAQSIFGVSATLAGATTYLMEIVLGITQSTGSTSNSVGIGFAGTATLTSIDYDAYGTRTATSLVTAGTPNHVRVGAATNTLIIAASTNYYGRIVIRGLVRINASGTFTPQITFSAAPGGAPTITRNSYITLTPLGGNATALLAGAWA